MTLKNLIDNIQNSGRVTQDMTRKEMLDCLDVIAHDIMSGNTTFLHANTLFAIRHSLMTIPEQISDYAKNVGEATKK